MIGLGAHPQRGVAGLVVVLLVVLLLLPGAAARLARIRKRTGS
jgi:hypothetical protein